MTDRSLITTGAIGAVLAAICCATPLLAVVLGSIGLPPHIIEPHAIFQRQLAAPRLVPVLCRDDAAVELDVAPQVELVGDVIEIAFGLGLGGKALAPIPLVEQLL